MYAIIDIGSNTIHMSVYTRMNDRIRKIINKKETVGLAEYINKDGDLTLKGMTRLMETLYYFKAILENLQIENVIIFATASLRNARNGAQVCELAKEKTGFDIRLLSGEEEGSYGYRGAIRNSVYHSGMLVDIGGGSTEIVIFSNDEIKSINSLPIGSLNMYRSYVADIIPTSAETDRIVRHTRDVLKETYGDIKAAFSADILSDIPAGYVAASENICAIGGTARAICRIFNQKHDIGKENTFFPLSFLKEEQKEMGSRRKETIDAILAAAPERIHTIMPGITILQTVAKYFQCKNIHISTYGVREGVLMEALDKETANE